MAIPKKGSRKIHVAGEDYRWLIRRKATYSQTDYGIGKLHVAIDHFETPGTSLVIFTDIPHPKDWSTEDVIPITPANIDQWILDAFELGWEPTKSGTQLRVKLENQKMILMR